MAAPLYNGLPDTDTMALLGVLETGKVVTIFSSRRRPERRTLEIVPLTSQLVWIRAQGAKPEGAINFCDIKEIRKGKNSKDFEKWPDDTRRVDPRLCFVVFYGNDFKLQTLSVVSTSVEDRDKWLRGIDYMMEDAMNVSYPMIVERWLMKEFNGMAERLRTDGLGLKNLKSWMNRINFKIATNRLREFFQIEDERRKNEVRFEEFMKLYHKLIHTRNVIDEHFSMYLIQQGSERIMTVEKFQHFLSQEQKEIGSKKPGVADVKNIMRSFLADPSREANLFFTEEEFMDYLFSKHNSIWNSSYDRVNQDMSRPLSHYWIASSHNTYLTGDQMASESSVEAYTRALKMGCKCLELDCWDGPDGQPLVYHGHTLTSKIRFMEVIQTIKDYAWVASDYPLILSIENHCTLGQQRNMATAFKDIFGETLLVEPVQRDATQLPSPDQLKRKVILKHKKLPADGTMSDPTDWRYNLDDNAREGDLSNSVKNGILYLEDPLDQNWRPHFFVLTTNKLYYSEETTNEEDEETEADDTTSLEGLPQNDLHYGEKWFHGRLPGGRRDAEDLLVAYKALGDGTFLVRESETFVGDFSLSFRWQNMVNHCRIKSKQELGQVKYFLIDNNTFDSLYNLIMYYRHNPLKSNNFTMTLKEPVPQPQSHEGKDWYHERCDRNKAEEMLKRIPYDGAFLVRHSDTDQASYAVSFRAEGKIKHCRIRQEGRLFTIGTAEFESLVELVQYYERHPLYKKMKLRKAVSEQLVEREGADPSEAGLYGQILSPDPYINPNDFTSKGAVTSNEALYEPGIYHLPNSFQSKVRVQALHDYTANRDDELSFSKGSIITNVNKHDNGWWRGDYFDKRQYWFPANFVSEIEPKDDSAESAPLGSLQKGAIDVHGCIVEESPQGRGDKPYVFKIFGHLRGAPLEVGCDSETDMSDWITNIRICACSIEEMQNQQRKKERQTKIAQEFSDLIVYCIAVQFDPDKMSGNFREMSSFQELKAERLCVKSKAKQFIAYNRLQLSRVYPKGPRVDSSNYDPIKMWNCGSQMCALNYQTPDWAMQCNQGRFLQNGNCGYVLQPDVMRNEDYSPFDKKSITSDPLTVSITLLGGRHLRKSRRGIVSPFVEIEVIGLDCDCNKFKTVPIADNGLCPVWSRSTTASMDFDIICPELALIRFVVQDEDMFGEPNFLGQATFPVTCLRSGYRSIQLKNEYSEPLELASLLINIDMKNPKETEDSDIYACIQELRDHKDDISARIEELESQGDAENAQQLQNKLQEYERNLIQMNEQRRQRRTTKQVVYRRTSTS